jgi:hypothetical protein
MSKLKALGQAILKLLMQPVPSDKLPPIDVIGPSEREVNRMRAEGKQENVVEKTLFRW